MQRVAQGFLSLLYKWGEKCKICWASSVTLSEIPAWCCPCPVSSWKLVLHFRRDRRLEVLGLGCMEFTSKWILRVEVEPLVKGLGLRQGDTSRRQAGSNGPSRGGRTHQSLEALATHIQRPKQCTVRDIVRRWVWSECQLKSLRS